MEVKPLYKTIPVIQNTKFSASNILIALLGTVLLVVSFISIVVLVTKDGNENTTFAAIEATAATTSASTAIDPETEILVLSNSINLLLDRIDSLEDQLSERSQPNVSNPQTRNLLFDRIESLENQLSERSQLNVSNPQPRMEVLTPRMGDKPRGEGVRPPPRENNGSAQGRPPREKQGPPPAEKKRSTQGKPPREKKGQRRRR